MCDVPVSRFDRDTAVERVAEDEFEARIDPSWWIVAGPNGGYLNAILLRAICERVGEPQRQPRTLTTHFTARAVEGPSRITTHIERSGRSFSTVSARMEQNDRLIAYSVAALASPQRPGFEFQDRRMPEVTPPTSIERRKTEGGRIDEFRRHFDQHSVWEAEEADPNAEAITGGWIRPHDPRGGDAILLSQLADAWPPALFSKWTPDENSRGVPTIELTVHFRAPQIALVVKPDEFYLMRFRTGTAHDGFLEEDGEIWSQDGVLLAQSRQLALLA
ncbi:MAG: thioesterase family protein [bacterium]|nr:thioesterase family protein [bacterium]